MKTTIKLLLSLLVITGIFFGCSRNAEKKEEITGKNIRHAEKLTGLSFTETERDSMVKDLIQQKEGYEKIRSVELPNSVPPVIRFDPVPGWMNINKKQQPIVWNMEEKVSKPDNTEELAFYSLPELASLIKSQKISSVELTKMYINRLKRYSDTLNCLITLTEELALEQARKADEEIRRGNYKGPLHGIPYGLKDLVTVEGYKTTWGAAAYKNQELEGNATVYKKLRDAGAVLVAKLSMGALAMGDVWYEATTKNPWDMEQGSSGSSAGSASATIAGLVGFSLGTETYGSIVSPSTRCGASGLRPTFGRVSRTGTMALSWTMDKIGPICRTAEGCAMVFNTIQGSDQQDLTVKDYPFNYNTNTEISELKVGYLSELFDQTYRGHKNDSLALEKIKDMGINLHSVNLPDSIPVQPLLLILEAEAAAAFDKLTRSNRDSLLVAQHRHAWPNIFRKSRFIPAVEYIQANRLRKILADQINRLFRKFDVIIAPSFGGNQLLTTNLTGHPCVVVPNGFDDQGHPTSISFLGNLYQEGKILEMANAFQKATIHDEQHPKYFKE
ncbi:MAG: amidase [Bacteroidales bacterium]|nr:amidase [Bacteroidales bacterium]MBS3775372.1 amidase [Bacteroidales bacterium]